MKPSSSDRTRQKLIEVATGLFAEVGYRATTVREIVRRADVNQAAINYHFQGKDALYREVMRQAFLSAAPLEARDGEAPEERLRSLIDGLLMPALEPAAPHLTFRRLMAWELIEPTGFLDHVERDGSVRQHAMAMDIVRGFLPDGTPEHQVAWAAFWLIGQCSMIRQVQQMMRLLPPSLAKSMEENRNALPAFFLQLALGGLKGSN